jgi:CRISPR-associated Csx2 family protein
VHSLVTFLGKGRGYSDTRYRFEDGTVSKATRFFGLALAEHIGPDQLIILGTPGSMWDALVGDVTPVGEEADIHIELGDAAARDSVTEKMLGRANEWVARAAGRPCTLRLMPYGRTPAEQTQILSSVADALPKEGRVSFDLTLGFRHLAALGLMSAFFLERVARLQIAGLYYGAFDMKDKVHPEITPVVRLDGLLQIQRWVDALDTFDGSGDYGVFAPLLVADGVAPDKARCLERAAFYERTSSAAKATEQVGTFLAAIEDGLPGTGRLFQERLRERLAWARAGAPWQQQEHLARVYLERRDYLRAAIFGWEALITRECERRGCDPSDFSGGRGDVEDVIEDEIKAGASSIGPDYWMLKDLRNFLAHGVRARRQDIREIVVDEGRLKGELSRLLKALFQ